jgi:hypothetical protein
MNEKMMKRLLMLAKSKTTPECYEGEYFIASECFDHDEGAYIGGVDDGQILMAREVLDSMGVEY